MDIKELLNYTAEQNASDLHLSTGLPPIIRKNGDLQIVKGETMLKENIIVEMLKQLLTDRQFELVKQQFEVDLSVSLSKLARFRVNIFHQMRGISVAFRTIPYKIPTLEELGMPASFVNFCDLPNGIVLVTGPTGSGKSTTLAAMINRVNQTRSDHILTLEDPVEFFHESKKCLIQQREIHQNTASFSDALRAALREDPDVILVGEMRDLETIRLALTAAETGHLVFATLHTSSAAKSINRIIDVFPSGEKDLIRSMLSESLRAIIAQTLLKSKKGGRLAAHEVLIANSAVRNLIREDKIPQIYSVIQTSDKLGMHTLEQNLDELVQKGLIDPMILTKHQQVLHGAEIEKS
ncbi:MAG: twitching motility protein PilT [Gammaproteobacteria bacterium RIFCSPHIGHO2_02_FULL_42_13]|nr:MAG: twitching motility protein PilT [Gammaproteobacteria bacterium RIFCSPHIGHO2_02_FULL_42_13]OGT68234.1 MAG: twitching motility protein PilT [Gammaproteobacteria bacterium RIFCSPLOWO2_02_FULL_42_9]